MRSAFVSRSTSAVRRRSNLPSLPIPLWMLYDVSVSCIRSRNRSAGRRIHEPAASERQCPRTLGEELSPQRPKVLGGDHRRLPRQASEPPGGGSDVASAVADHRQVALRLLEHVGHALLRL